MRNHLTPTRNSARRFRRLLLIAVATAVLAVGAITAVSMQRSALKVAQEPQRGSLMANEANKKYVRLKVAGQEVQVDSQTGQIRPLTPQEAQKLAQGLKEMMNRSADGLTQVQEADGSVSMDLEGRFQNVTVARINADGSLSESCVDNPRSAAAFFGIDPKLIETRPKEK